MRRPHAFLIALLLGLTVVAAGYAVLRTTSLGMSAKQTAAIPDEQIAARKAKLDKVEAALARALAKKPPALPKLPKRRSAPVARVVSAPAPSSASTRSSNSGPGSIHGDDDSDDSHEDDGGDDD